MLSPLHDFAFCQVTISFVPLDYQVDIVSKGCSTVAVVESAIVPQWRNAILDLNGILYSFV